VTRNIELTYDEAKADLIAIVQEQGPDFIYDQPEEFGSCVYFNTDGTPSCGIGHVAARHGVTAEEWADVNTDTGVKDLMGDVIRGDRTVAILFATFQQKQDASVPWGDAAVAAFEAVEDDVVPTWEQEVTS
jgi:hypothetical protein